jgi:hypothetical protein
LALYEEMQAETAEIIKTFDFNNLFLGILQAPKMTFDISIKYLFFYIDYVEIRRGYAELFVKVEADNERRKAGYLHILKQLQVQGILRKELSDADLDYLMELSGAMRTFFFMKLNPENFTDPDLKDRYVDYVNRLVFPYLTATGIEQYEAK